LSRELRNVIVFAFVLAALMIVLFMPKKKHSFVDVYDPLNAVPQDVCYYAKVGEREFLFFVKALEIISDSGYNIVLPPPLKPQDAVAVCTDTLARYVPYDEVTQWLPDSIALNRFLNNKWYYTVSFRPAQGGLNDDGSVRRVQIPVLFNRMVIRGIERNDWNSSEVNYKAAAEELGLESDQFLTAEQKNAANVAQCADLSFNSRINGHKFHFTLTKDRLEKTDDCNIYSELPLELHKAAAAALVAYPAYVDKAQVSDWHVKRILLNRWGNSDKWYYLIEFTKISDDERESAPRLSIPVLMNGEAVNAD